MVNGPLWCTFGLETMGPVEVQRRVEMARIRILILEVLVHVLEGPRRLWACGTGVKTNGGPGLHVPWRLAWTKPAFDKSCSSGIFHAKVQNAQPSGSHAE